MSTTKPNLEGLSLRSCLDLGIDPIGLVFKDSQTTKDYTLIANCNPEGTRFVFVNLNEMQESANYNRAIHKCDNSSDQDKYWMKDLFLVLDSMIPSDIKPSLHRVEMNILTHSILGDGKRYSIFN